MANSEPMTDDRWAEIRELTADVSPAYPGGIHIHCDEATAWLAILDLRREVERLRAEADQLRRELSTTYALLDEHHIQR